MCVQELSNLHVLSSKLRFPEVKCVLLSNISECTIYLDPKPMLSQFQYVICFATKGTKGIGKARRKNASKEGKKTGHTV